jgi:hypothetical protein
MDVVWIWYGYGKDMVCKWFGYGMDMYGYGM